jgi:hypothetical protein
MVDVLKSTEYVIENSRFVKINREKTKELAEKWSKSELIIPGWDRNYHFSDDSEKTCEYLFVLDSINFCFWAKEAAGKWKIDYNGKKIDGYNALAFSLKGVFEKERFSSFDEFNYSEFEKFFKGENEMPLLKERFEILQENYKILKSKYGGKLSTLIECCNYDVLTILSELTENFPSFRDESEYKGKRIAFYKRAQILVGDLYCAFSGRKWGNLKNIDKLTMFADYKVPQILRSYGILEYNEDLSEKLNNREMIISGSEEETEIRANAVWAIEFLKGELEKKDINLRSFEVDWFLWNLVQSEHLDLKPYHLTETIFY